MNIQSELGGVEVFGKMLPQGTFYRFRVFSKVGQVVEFLDGTRPIGTVNLRCSKARAREFLDGCGMREFLSLVKMERSNM